MHGTPGLGTQEPSLHMYPGLHSESEVHLTTNSHFPLRHSDPMGHGAPVSPQLGALRGVQNSYLEVPDWPMAHWHRLAFVVAS